MVSLLRADTLWDLSRRQVPGESSGQPRLAAGDNTSWHSCFVTAPAPGNLGTAGDGCNHSVLPSQILVNDNKMYVGYSGKCFSSQQDEYRIDGREAALRDWPREVTMEKSKSWQQGRSENIAAVRN